MKIVHRWSVVMKFCMFSFVFYFVLFNITSSPLHVYSRFHTENSWGQEQQQSYHTILRTSSFKSKLFLRFWLELDTGIKIAHTWRLHDLQIFLFRVVLLVYIFKILKKAQPQTVINMSKSDLTLKYSEKPYCPYRWKNKLTLSHAYIHAYIHTYRFVHISS